MSSTGPGSLLVFLAFLMLSMLLTGTYFMAYVGLVQAGAEVQKAGEAASEQAIVYLFQHPTNVSLVNGSAVIKGETRIVIQNVGSRDISFDRILAISPDGSVVADVKVPGNKGLGVRQWQLYKVQDLDLPERWNNFTVFSSEVSRLVLLSERGRTHGSIWGVPPFLEGIFRATVATTMTTSYFYSYIETTEYKTTYTITLRAKPNKWSVMGEIWISDDGTNWGRVGRGWDLYSGPMSCPNLNQYDTDWCTYYWSPGYVYWGYSFRYLNSCRGGSGYNNCLINAGPPTIAGSSIVLAEKGDVIVYRVLYVSDGTRLTVNTGNSFWQTGVTFLLLHYYGYYYYYYRDWRKHYVPQAIELVDWDTGEVYGSTDSTSFTFPVLRNTIVRFKYVLAESWSREWHEQWGGPPSPKNCTEIINTRTPGDPDWCDCARQYLPKEAWKDRCLEDTCFTVKVEPCCLKADPRSCVDPWSPGDGRICVRIPANSTATLTVDWSASWGLKPGWVFDEDNRVLKTGVHADIANCQFTTYTPDSGYVSGRCSIEARAGGHYYVTMKVVFKRAG
jgi:hypothetical protein